MSTSLGSVPLTASSQPELIDKFWILAGKNLTTAMEPEDHILERQWVQTIAHAILRNPVFHYLMKNPPEIEDIALDHAFVASINLPYRFQKYSNYQFFRDRFLSKTGENQRIRIIRTAMDLYRDLFGTKQQHILGTRLAPPVSNPDRDELRKDIYRFHFVKSQERELIKECTDHEFNLARQLSNAALSSTEPAQMEMRDRLVSELRSVQQTKAAVRDNMEKMTTVKLESYRLLEGVAALVPDPLTHQTQGQPTVFPLYRVRPGLSPVTTVPINRTDVSDDQAFCRALATTDEYMQRRAEIDVKKPCAHSIIFLGNHSFDTLPALRIKTRSSAARDAKDPVTRPGDRISLFSKDAAVKAEGNIADAVKKLAETIDEDRFQLNMRHFESIDQRPAVMANAAAHDGLFDLMPQQPWFVEDNLYHVRAFAMMLVDQDLVRTGGTLKIPRLNDLAKVLRLMWCLVALMYGCVQEGSILLTAMDSLLEDLAGLVVGHVDDVYATVTMRRLERILAQGEEITELPTTGREDILALAKEDRARIIVGELARFYRGAVLMAYASVNWGAKGNAETWFTGLLSWCNECGSQSCKERLEMYYDPRLKIRKWGMSIAVRDPRLGFMSERAEISQNRLEAYPCLARFVERLRYHAGFGPFFHYFAHVYHVACKPHRGKESIMDAIARMAAED